MTSPLKSTNFTQNCRTEHNERKDSCPCAHVLLVMRLNFKITLISCTLLERSKKTDSALMAVQIQGNRRINSFHARSVRMQFAEIVLLTIAVRYPRQIILKLFSYFCPAFGVHRREAFILLSA